MIKLIVSLLLTAAALGALYYGYQEIRILRGTWFWDLRYLVLAVGAFVLLSLAEFIASFFGKPDADHD